MCLPVYRVVLDGVYLGTGAEIASSMAVHVVVVMLLSFPLHLLVQYGRSRVARAQVVFGISDPHIEKLTLRAFYAVEAAMNPC